MIGGKLLDGCEVYRTAEIILGKIMGTLYIDKSNLFSKTKNIVLNIISLILLNTVGMRFRRKYDKETGYFELAPDVISPIT